jgi:hypothetical protein
VGLAYAAQSFVPLTEGGEPAIDAVRLCSFIDGYRLDHPQREALPEKIVERTRAMHQLLERSAKTGEQPWARLHAEGHADYWSESAVYVERHLEIWKHALLANDQD